MIEQTSIHVYQPIITIGNFVQFGPQISIPAQDYPSNIDNSICLSINHQMEVLRGIYIFKNPEEVTGFLLSNKNLIKYLLEAPERIYRIFGSVHLYLELYQDPEEAFECLFIIVKTDLPPEEAINNLDRFDEEYWLNLGDEINNKLEVTVRPL
ncbi:MAG: hypothetical protein NUV70_07755 [Caldiserica bacterium]|jgi:hypothetical protein|nr:hypothetical protein [Caldisericota bacterium]